MKKVQQVSLVLMTAVTLLIYSCGPNDNKGSMDQENSNKEGAVDSTKVPNFDSTHATDSSHASVPGRNSIRTVRLNSIKIKTGFNRKNKSYFC